VVGADNGDKFLALWRGDTSIHGGDHSRADQALVSMLAFWTNYDAARVDRLFRQSGLMRDKWHADSYRRATLRKAGL
jgi:primase-polymerase (primpol)-like protein